jgi:hypothetical protein
VSRSDPRAAGVCANARCTFGGLSADAEAAAAPAADPNRRRRVMGRKLDSSTGKSL